MREYNNMPEIRFKGFDGEWVSATLGNSVSYVKGFAFKSNEYKDNGIRIVRVSDLTKNSLSESSCKVYLSKSKTALYSNYIINSGDIVITTVGSKAEMRESAVGRAIIFTKSEGHFLNQNLVKVTPTIGNDSQFIYNQLLRERYANFIENIQRGNANQANIAIKDLWEYSLNFPKFKQEQVTIGNFFQKLDNSINQHQKKHNKLSNIKKSMLEKMFPKKDETVPEIRFKGFGGEWEEVALGENARFTKGQSYSKNDLSEIGTPIILYGRLYTKYQTVIFQVDTFAKEKSKSLKSVGNEVIVPASGETSEDIARASAVCESGVILGGDLNVIYPNNNINPVFLALMISNGYPHKELASKAQGKSIVHIRNSDLEALLFKMPKKEEQTAIGNYFQKLDTLINQHQQQITKLNNIKQACLSTMFV